LKYSNPIIKSQFEKHPLRHSQILKFDLHPFTGFHLAANVFEEFENYGKWIKLRTNNLGFFSDFDFGLANSDHGFTRNQSDRLVILTGGSGAMGWGATSNQSMISYVLEKKLNARIPLKKGNWRVLNFANGSWICFQEYLALSLYGVHLRPDFVISLTGRNDLFVPVFHGEKVPNHFCFNALNDLYKFANDHEEESILEKYLPFIKNMRVGAKFAKLGSTPLPDSTKSSRSAASSFLASSVSLICDVVPKSKKIIALQPTLFLSSHYSPWDKRERFGSIPLPEFKSQVQEFYSQSDIAISGIKAVRQDVEYINLAQSFLKEISYNNYSDYLLDDCHFTDAGQDYVAEKFFNEIFISLEE
jgi:hypothetical protein